MTVKKSECSKWRKGTIALRHLLRLLRSNTSGNVLIITALCLVPLLMLIGSAVDISRATMAKSRLQNACDAASLAARRVMRNDTFDDTVSNTGRQFFAFNFPQRSFDTDTFTPQITRPSAGVVRVAASTHIHNQIMNIFGFDKIALNVNCDASLNFVNTDVVLVLDVTGSMADAVGGTAKIAALRSAVMALYDELAPIQQQLEAQGLRLRYGIVPYSSSVNVGRLLYAANPAYLTSTTSYQSRVATTTRLSTPPTRRQRPVRGNTTTDLPARARRRLPHSRVRAASARRGCRLPRPRVVVRRLLRQRSRPMAAVRPAVPMIPGRIGAGPVRRQRLGAIAVAAAGALSPRRPTAPHISSPTGPTTRSLTTRGRSSNRLAPC